MGKNSKTRIPHSQVNDDILPLKGVKNQHLADKCVTARCIADGAVEPQHLSPLLSFQTVPVGSILPWYDFNGLVTLPAGWWYCNGQLIDDPISPLFNVYTPDLSESYLIGAGAAGGGDIGTAPTNAGTVPAWSTAAMVGQNNLNSSNLDLSHAHVAATHASDTFGAGTSPSLTWPTFQWDKTVLNVDQLPHYHVESMNVKDVTGEVQRTYDWGFSSHTVDWVETPSNVLTPVLASPLILPHTRSSTVSWNSSTVATTQVGGSWGAGSLPSFSQGAFNGGSGSFTINDKVGGNKPRSLPVRYIIKIV